MVFQTGDKVKVVDDDLSGTVRVLLSGGLVLIEDEDGFERKYLAGALTLASSDEEYGSIEEKAEWAASHEKRSDTLRRVRNVDIKINKGIQQRKAPDVDMEVDLHLHEIIDNERGMSDADKIHYQISYFERMLEKAIMEKKNKVVFIHGIGKGRLRDEMRRIMNYYTNVQYFDADHRKYGSGATEVVIHHI